MSSHRLSSCMLLTLQILQLQVYSSFERNSIPPQETMVWPCSVVQMKEIILCFWSPAMGNIGAAVSGQVWGKHDTSTVWSFL